MAGGIEVNSLDKLRATLDDPFHLKFVEKYLRSNTLARFARDSELDPSKDLKYA